MSSVASFIPFDLELIIVLLLSVLIEVPGAIPEPKAASGGAPVYFESLALQPIQLELSFMRTDRVNVEEKQ